MHYPAKLQSFCIPIVVVQKKDGSIRLCVDYRLLNVKTRKDALPLPRIDESLDALGTARWFYTLDLASGYNQVPIAEKDKAKTAFCTPFGLNYLLNLIECYLDCAMYLAHSSG